MSPLILVIGIITFLISFSLHVIWWRWRRPKNDIIALVISFFFLPFLFFLIACIFRISLVNLLFIFLLHSALSGAYIMSYPVVQADSPMLNILLVINRAMPKGIRKEEIKQEMGSDDLLNVCMQKIVEEGFAKEAGDEIIPTIFGKIIASFFIMFRSFLGLEQGKG